MQQISGKTRKRHVLKDVRQTGKHTKPKREISQRDGETSGTKQQPSIQSTGFNYSTLKFEPLAVYESFMRAGGSVYSKELIKTFISFVSCARHLEECKVSMNDIGEWSLPRADYVIQNVYETLKSEHEYNMFISIDDDIDDDAANDISYHLENVRKESDDYIVFYNDHGQSTGALFLKDYTKFKSKKDQEIAFQALKLVKSFALNYWYETYEWEIISDQIETDKQIREDLKKANYKISDEDEGDELIQENGGYGYSNEFIKHYDIWETKPLINNVRFASDDLEELYDRAYLHDDNFALWLKAVLHLYLTDFSLWQFDLSRENCQAVETHYAIFYESDTSFIGAWDEYHNNGHYEGSPGMTSMQIITPEGIVYDTLNSPAPAILDLVFSYNPKDNRFYDSFISDKRIDTYASYLNLSKQRERYLRGIFKNKCKRQGRRF